jgi:hypothetical protein
MKDGWQMSDVFTSIAGGSIANIRHINLAAI